MMQGYVELIREGFPDLAITSVREISGGGQFSIVLVINEAIIFRFPRTDEVAISMAREVGILLKLQGRVSLPIPKPIYFNAPDRQGRLKLMGYPMLAGEPMSARTLDGAGDAVVDQAAADLAGFLRGLHSIRPAEIGLDLPSEGGRDEWVQMYDDFRAELYSHMRLDARSAVSEAFESALADYSLWDFEPVLCHGDFGGSNLLFDPARGAISGVIDFGMVGLGDPAQDVGAAWSLGDRFMERFLHHYPEMRAVVPRVKFIRSTYALQQALWAQRYGDQDDFEDGIQDYR